jgi:hypothetical protein
MNALLPRACTKTTLTATSVSHALIALVARATAAAAQAQVIARIAFQDDISTPHPPHEHVQIVTSDSTKAARMKRHASYAEVGNIKMSQHRPTAHPAKLGHSLLSSVRYLVLCVVQEHTVARKLRVALCVVRALLQMERCVLGVM